MLFKISDLVLIDLSEIAALGVDSEENHMVFFKNQNSALVVSANNFKSIENEIKIKKEIANKHSILDTHLSDKQTVSVFLAR